MKQCLVFLLCVLPLMLLGQEQTMSLPSPAEGYMIVAPRAYREVLQPLVLWRLQEGYNVEQLYVDSADCTTIHDELQRRYDQSSRLHPFAKYILLVGDVGQIESFAGRHKPSGIPSTHYTDLYYGEFTSDYQPESLVGRLPARDTTEVRKMVENLMQYEQQRGIDCTYLQRALLVAGKESGSPAPTTSNGAVNYLKEQLSQQYSETDTACYYNPTSDTMLESILTRLRMGNGIVYYTGHGNTSGWVHPNLHNSIIDTLSVPTPSLYINNACLTLALQNDCMGKKLMLKEDGGAIGVIGASNEALWNEDYYWAVGGGHALTAHPTFDSTLPGFIDYLLRNHNQRERVTLGQMLYYGNLSVGRSGSPYGAYYWEIYNLLGDPALMPYIGIPDSLPLQAPDSIEDWVNEITVQTLPYARVAASIDTLLLGANTADSTGLCRLMLSQPDRNLTHCTLKATLGQHLPTLHHIGIRTSSTARLSLVEQSLTHPTPLSDSDTLNLTLKLRNRGHDTLVNHSIILLTTQDSLVEPIPLLAPDSSCAVSFFIPYTIDTATLWNAQLLLADTVDTYSAYPICHELPHLMPTLTAYQIQDEEGDAVRQLKHNHTYQLRVVVHNPLRNPCLLQLQEETISIAAESDDTLFFPIVTPNNSQHHLHLHPHLTLQSSSATEIPTEESWWIIGDSREGFEGGKMEAFPWDTTYSVHPWRNVDDSHQQGNHSTRSGAIGHQLSTRLQLVVENNADDTITFWLRTSSESGSDKLNFYIDGKKKSYWSGDNGWKEARFAVGSGWHTLLWEYSKDISRSQGSDCVWIDEINLPLSRWEAPYGYFDTTIVDISRPTTHRSQQLLAVTPNPTTDWTTITLYGEESGTLQFFNRQGIMVDEMPIASSQKNNPQVIQYSTAHLRSDVYLVVFVGRTTMDCKKLVVAH